MFVLKVAAKSHNYMISSKSNRLKKQDYSQYIYIYIFEGAGRLKTSTETFLNFYTMSFKDSLRR